MFTLPFRTPPMYTSPMKTTHLNPILPVVTLALLTACGSVSSGGGGGSDGSGGSGGSSGAGGAMPGNATMLFDAAGSGVNPWGIAVDANNVYFSDAQGPNGKVFRVPLDGSGAAELANGQSSPSAILVDGSDVYFITSDALMKVPAAGGPVQKVADAENATYSGLAVDADHIYWTDYTSPGRTMRIAKAGGPPEMLASGDGYPSGIAVAGGQVYWAVLSDNEIRQVPAAGGMAGVFAANQNAPRWGFASDGVSLYWLTEGDFPMHLMKAPLAGGQPSLIATSPSQASMASTLVVDASHAYFALPECAIAKVPLAGGPVEQIAIDQALLGCPIFLAGDAANLYFTGFAGVSRIPK